MCLQKLTMKYADQLDGCRFEWFCASLFRLIGHYDQVPIKNVQTTQKNCDHGLDITMETNESGKKNKKIGIQVKHRSKLKNTVGYTSLEEVSGGMMYYFPNIVNQLHQGWNNNAIVMTNGFFTPEAKKSDKRMGIRLIDRPMFSRIVNYAQRNLLGVQLNQLEDALDYHGNAGSLIEKALNAGIPRLLKSKAGAYTKYNNDMREASVALLIP